MFAGFEAYCREDIKLTEAEFKLLCSASVERALRRKEVLLRMGEICKEKIFILDGFLRTYRVKEDGSEHIVQFSTEGSWTTEPESYHNATPSQYCIDALEPTTVMVWTKADFDALFLQIPRMKAFTDKMISDNMYINRNRLYTTISSNAEERYDEFIKSHPGVANRVPLHMIASYLGVSRETLSRIRHAQVKG